MILPAARELVPVISFIAYYRKELVAAMANLAADLEATAPAATPTGRANYMRAVSVIGRESVYGQSVREPTNRSNTYYSPGELARMGQGLYSASCSNTTNASQLPIVFGNVPCLVQPLFHWGNGIPDSYYPHLTRSPAP